MANQSEGPSDEKQKHLNTLVEYERTITRNQDLIEKVFEKTVDRNLIFNNFEEFFGRVESIFQEQIEDEEDAEIVCEAVINVPASIADGDNILESLERKGASEDLRNLFLSLSVNYGTQLNRRINRFYKGQDWWSNIHTNVTFRQNRPIFIHELVIDYDERFRFSNDIANEFTLVNHILDHLISAPDILGEDVLAEIPETQLEATKEKTESLIENLEDYKEQFEEVEENDEEEDREENEEIEG